MKKFLLVLIAIILMIPSYAANTESGNIIIFMYHDFREGSLNKTDDSAYVTTDIKFREDIEKLLSKGFESLNLEMLYNGDYNTSKDYFIITVDDGYISNYEVLFPILEELEIYADVFICTENAVRTNHFQYSEGKKMEDSGLVKIYSHFTKHIDVLSIDIGDFNRLAEKSLRNIEKKISEDRLRIFAYPHGSYSRETVENLYEMGVVFQMVQDVIETDNDWNPADYGVLYRVNVEYDSDIIELTEYYITQFCER